MKFGESLSDGLVPEWKSQYVDYKAGKKLIKKTLELSTQTDASDIEIQPPTSLSSTMAIDNKNPTYIKGPNDRTPLLKPTDEAQLPLTVPIEAPKLKPSGQVPAPGSDSVKQRRNTNSSNNAPSKKMFNYSFKYKKDKDINDFDTQKARFVEWIESELNKVNQFYSEKEMDFYQRFLLLQDQLYQLREHKLQVNKSRSGKNTTKVPNLDKVYRVNDITNNAKGVIKNLNRFELPSFPSLTFLRKWRRNKEDHINDDISLHNSDSDSFHKYDPTFEENQIRNGQIMYNSKYKEDDDDDTSGTDENESIISSDLILNRTNAPVKSTISNDLNHTLEISQRLAMERRKKDKMDYSRKKKKFGVPYLLAKKQLKDALVEHYRSLTLLKSYKVMNRTAFRKITKKFNKATNTKALDQFMEKVDDSYFQTSDLIDKLVKQVEELYLVFFDHGSDRKHSLEKLRSIAFTMNTMESKQNNYYSSLFASGLFLGFGFPLFALGVYQGISKSVNLELPEGKFLLQIWAGFFLMIAMTLLSCINLLVFDHFKINYKFIFEFNLATCLNYKQYLFIPSFAFALLSILGWFSFMNFWPTSFPGRDWPWIFLGIMLVIFLWPGNLFYGPSRKWFQIALWRLLLSGFYPVEFRDFFLGDIFSSLTYTMGNISFFFCLYSHHWNGLVGGNISSDNRCGSSKSRLMGFFSTLPSIWRFLQCMRRYMDTGDWFPHIANMMKYSITIVYYSLLSVYRIKRTNSHRIAFIIIASLNSIYASTWDIVMDWSLLQNGSKNFLLRDNLIFRKPIYYYVAMVVDVVLRFQWVFYACFAQQIQQSAVTSFCIALAEVVRRFIWIFFRMENEHSTNVTLFRASRESPLPYKIKYRVEKAIKKLVKLRYESQRFESNDQTVVNIPSASMSSAFSKNATNDEECDIGLRKSTKIIPDEAKLRRKSTLFTFANALNRAHIKDFQRRKTVMDEDGYSDLEDEEDGINEGNENSEEN